MKKNHICQSLITAAALSLAVSTSGLAADHRDAPTLAYDAASDIADLYFFRDPTDTGKVVLIGTVAGFIVPGEASNQGIFDPVVRYRFEIFDKHVNTARPANPLEDDTAAVKKQKNAAIKKYVDSIKPDKFIDVTFSPRATAAAPVPPAVAGKEALQITLPQLARVQFTGFPGIANTRFFTADVTNPTLGAAANTQKVTSLSDVRSGPHGTTLGSDTGIKFFAGETDDPFFFDIPAFSSFIKSIREGAPNTSVFNRARDTFAGYNVLSIALSLPIEAVRDLPGRNGAIIAGPGPIIGVDFLTQRHNVNTPTKIGDVKGVGAFATVDREGNPAVNVVLVPAVRKNEYNAATVKDDAALRFALDTPAKGTVPSKPGILATLAALGTTGSPFDGFGVSSQGTLAAIAVLQGDLLKLDTTAAATVGFPNGRRLNDDVVDTLLNVVTNGALTTGDKVNGNDLNGGVFGTAFPFLLQPQQPRLNGVTDDNTRN